MSRQHQQRPVDVNDEGQWEHLVSGLFLDDPQSPTNPVLETIPGWDSRFSTIGQKQSFLGSPDSQSNVAYDNNNNNQHEAQDSATRGSLSQSGRQQPPIYHEYNKGNHHHRHQQQQSRYNFQQQDAALAAFNGEPSHSGSGSGNGGVGSQQHRFVGMGDHPIEQMPNRGGGNDNMSHWSNNRGNTFPGQGGHQMSEVHLSHRISESSRQERKHKERPPSHVVEHECTSRTLFVRNISSNTEDKELVDLFEFYGDIRDMYSACKYRGFVMISFFDERAATAAMDCLQGKALSRRKLDIHFSIPKENQVDAGMLLVFNLEQKTPNSVIATLFRAFGDIKSIKSMQNHSQPMDQNSRIAIRMIEYYDERHAAAALKALNGADVWNIKIRIQFGRVSRVVSHHQKRQSLRTNEYSGLSGQEDLLVNNQVGYHDHGAPSADQDYQAGCNIHLQQPQQQQQQQQIFMPPRRYQMHHNSGGDQGLPGPSGDTMTGQQTHQHQGYPPHRHSNHHNSHNSHFAYDSHHQQQQHGSNYKRMGGGHPHQHQAKNKSHFSLNLQNIMEGKDRKTTVMIRNIPNKYTQKMLLAEIDVELKGKYDFFYLPIDFKNKCNVGYAFMNLIDPFCILKLYEQFNGKRWSHFNSGKICEITYARIQGKQALTAHFRHSALMQVDEECQPMFPYGQAPVYNQQENTTYA